jgi:HlyD family secretion protein
MTTWTRRAALIAGIAAVALLGGWYLTRAAPVAVLLAAVDRGRVVSSVANTRAGTIEACQRARLAPNAGGQIARMPVREGDVVAKGDLLLELWNEDIAAQLVLAEREIAAARARVDEACTLASVAERDAARLQNLRSKGVASEESTEKAVGEAQARRAACRAAESSSEVTSAQVDVMRANLERTRLYAPFGGVIAEINGELGEFVTPSPIGIATPPTVDLIDTACLYVKAPIDEVDAGGVRRGMPARVVLDAFADRSFAGRVRRVANYVLEVEKQARTVDVEVELEPDSSLPDLLAGYSADVEVILATRDDVVRVPTEAVLEGPRVLVYAGGRLEERRIRSGLSNWEHTEVAEGLSPGEQVVLSVDREGVKAGIRAVPDETPRRASAG